VTILAPSSAAYNSSNDTYTYTTPIQLKDSQGHVVKTYYTVVPVARVTRNVITGYYRSTPL
jgi:hypothetical protein